MEDERNNVNREYKDRLFKRIFREKEDLYSSRRILLLFPQFIVFYNGTREEPERQVLHLYDSFPREILKALGRDGAALHCHAVVININYGHNQEIMKRCRKLEEYSVFVEKIRDNTSRQMPIREAIDRAVDECIKEGILEKILRENCEEVCSMLLTEYDEQAHIESEKKIAREEGKEEGRMLGIQEGIGVGIQQGENLLSTLVAYLKKDGRMDDLDLILDEEARRRLYREYHLAD